MLRMEWNRLAQGDHVLVHDVDHPDLALVPGTVSLVERTAGSNVVAVMLTKGGDQRIVRPHRLAVHHDPVGFDEQCWRCDRPPRARPSAETTRRRP